jgi:carbonic anhydrase
MAAVFHFHKDEIEEIKYFISREKIRDIIIAADTSCRFINGALKHEKQFGSHAETLIENIMLENKNALSNAYSEMEKQRIIAKEIISIQAQEICSPDLLLSEILKNKIIVKGIITTKSNNEITEPNFNNNYK